MIHYLTENDRYKVYAIYENVYLKEKATSNNLDNYEEDDINIAWHYGDPNAAIILNSGQHLIIGGCGLTIYDLKNKTEKTFLDDPDDISWVFALYQDGIDDQYKEFRFVAYYDNDKLRVFKMNIETDQIVMMD